MNGWTVTLIGLVAAIGTTGSWIPQAVKTIRSGSARDFSWSYLIMFSTGVALWSLYGMLRNDMVIVLTNVTALLFLVPIWIVKSGGKR